MVRKLQVCIVFVADYYNQRRCVQEMLIGCIVLSFIWRD